MPEDNGHDEPYEGDELDDVGNDGDEDESKQRWWHDRRKLAAALIAAAVAIGGGAALAYELLKRPEDVRNPNAAFEEEGEQGPVVKATNWPLYGGNLARTRYLPANRVRPPFRRSWKFGDGPLIEFPPIFVNGRLYFANNNGETFALDADTGRVLWKRKISDQNGTASSPAYSRGRLFIVTLSPARIRALDAKTGKTLWKRDLPGRAESSPLVLGNKVIFGCENGQLFAVTARHGRTIWTADLAGAVKAAPAFRDGILYVGDYGGEMSAVRASNGEITWQAGGLGGSFGRSGEFYSTPAVAFGRVYAGNNDGRIYSFEAETGELAWTQSVDGYAYSSPTVADTEDTPPSVYIGSYGGTLYAFDAKTGEERWTADPGGRVIGSTLGVGNIVYVSEFDETTTTGWRMRDGEKAFEFHTGAYHAGITDGRRLYLVGYSSIHALEPIRRGARPQRGNGAGARRRGTGNNQG